MFFEPGPLDVLSNVGFTSYNLFLIFSLSIGEHLMMFFS